MVRLDWIRAPFVSLTVDGLTETGRGRLIVSRIAPVKWLRLLMVIHEL